MDMLFLFITSVNQILNRARQIKDNKLRTVVYINSLCSILDILSGYCKSVNINQDVQKQIDTLISQVQKDLNDIISDTPTSPTQSTPTLTKVNEITL